MLVKLDELRQLAVDEPSIRQGCIIDTNVLFAASYGQDIHNEWAEELFELLLDLRIPVFTNINIRSEFIDLNRRVLLPECLIDFYEENKGSLNLETQAKLKSLKTRMDKASREERTFKLSDSEIKTYRQLLSQRHTTGVTNWDVLCESRFGPYLRPIWDNIVRDLNVQFLGTRAIESGLLFGSQPTWTDMISIVGRFGIGSTDAMIINLYLHSTLSLIVTTDKDVSETTVKLAGNAPNKYTLVSN